MEEPPVGSGGSQVADARLITNELTIFRPPVETESEGLSLHKGSWGTSRADALERSLPRLAELSIGDYYRKLSDSPASIGSRCYP
jgi:hypothetical protein